MTHASRLIVALFTLALSASALANNGYEAPASKSLWEKIRTVVTEHPGVTATLTTLGVGGITGAVYYATKAPAPVRFQQGALEHRLDGAPLNVQIHQAPEEAKFTEPEIRDIIVGEKGKQRPALKNAVDSLTQNVITLNRNTKRIRGQLNDLQTVVVQTGTDVRTVGNRVDALQAHVNNLVIPARQPITGTGVLKVLGGIALGVVAVKGTNIAMEMACEGSDSTLCDDKKAAKLIKDTVTEKGRKAIAALDDAATTARREFGSK